MAIAANQEAVELFCTRHHVTPAELLITWQSFPELTVRRRAGARESLAATMGVSTTVLAAIESADLIVIAPSHPVASVLPILDIGSVRAAVQRSRAPVVAISPIVSGVAIGDPGEARRARSRERMMATLAVPATAAGVASLYRGLVDRFVIDAADVAEHRAVAALGMDVVCAPTLVHLDAPPQLMLDAVLGEAGIAASR